MPDNALGHSVLLFGTPGKTGFEVCQAIKSRLETMFIPVILVTGLTEVDDRIQGNSA